MSRQVNTYIVEPPNNGRFNWGKYYRFDCFVNCDRKCMLCGSCREKAINWLNLISSSIYSYTYSR